MSGTSSEGRRAEPAQSDGQSVLEDVTGFNFRSLRTVRDLFVRPNAVFRAYAARDRETYAPPVRVWLGLIGLQVVFSVVYGGYGGLVRAQLAEADPATLEALQSVIPDLDAFTEVYGDVATFLHPLLVGGFTALSLFFLMPLNKTIGWPVRLNLTFAILTAGSVIGLLAMVPMAFGSRFNAVSLVLVFATYFATYVRGAPGVLAETRGQAVGKGIVFSLGMIALVFAGGIALTVVAGIAAFAATAA